MSRQIQTAPADPTLTSGSPPDGYLDKLLKYVPADVIAAYLAADAITRSAIDDDPNKLFSYLRLFLIVGTIVTPLYLWRVGKVSKPLQLGLSTVAFVAWVLGIGGAFAFTDWYEPFQGGLVVILSTLLIPLVDP